MRPASLLACAVLLGCGGGAGGKRAIPDDDPQPPPGPTMVPAVLDGSLACLHPYPELVAVGDAGIDLCSQWQTMSDEEMAAKKLVFSIGHECARLLEDRLVEHTADRVAEASSPIDEADLGLVDDEVVADWSVSPFGDSVAILVAPAGDTDQALRVELWDLAGPARRLVTPVDRGLYVDHFGSSFLVSSDHDDGGMGALWHLAGKAATEVWTSDQAALSAVMLDDRRLAVFIEGTTLMVVDVSSGVFGETIPLAWLIDGLEDDFENEGALELDVHAGSLVIAAAASTFTRIGVIGPDGARHGVDVPVCQ